MLDAIGCAHGRARRGLREPPRRRRRRPRRHRPRRTRRRRSASPTRLPLRDAALLNGMLMHGLDYDDTHMAGIVHLTVSVLPTLLALGGAARHARRRRRSSPTSPRSRAARASPAPPRAAFTTRASIRPASSARSASAIGAGRLLGLDAAGARAGAGHRPVDGQRQPAVPRGRRLDQAACIPAGRRRPAITAATLRGARHPGAARRLRRPLRPLSRSTSAPATSAPISRSRPPAWRRRRAVDLGADADRGQALRDLPLLARRAPTPPSRCTSAASTPARIRSVEARLPAGNDAGGRRARRGQAPADERLRRQVQRCHYAVASGLAARPPRPARADARRLHRPAPRSP